VTIINSIFKDLIPTFDVALAFSKLYKKMFDNNKIYYVSRKLDGIRCITLIDDK